MLVEFIQWWPTKVAVPAIPYQNMIAFGDSLSDAAPTYRADHTQKGNNTWVHPNGVTSYTGAPITNALSATDASRYLWVNYLIQAYPFSLGGHDLLIRRDLAVLASSKKTSIKAMVTQHNVSYATASAETGNNYINDKQPSPWPTIDCTEGFVATATYSCVPSLLKQIHLYLDDVDNDINPHSLFVIWIGGNDFYQNILKLLSKDNKEPLSHPIRNTTKAVQILLNKGVPAEHIFVFDLPNFSLVPSIISLVNENIQNPMLRKFALRLISATSTLYNSWLKTELVLATRGAFSPAQLFSTSDLLTAIKDNKDDIRQRLGIHQPLSQSCTAAKQLPVCAGFFFYNDMHPTTTVHAFIAEQFKVYALDES